MKHYKVIYDNGGEVTHLDGPIQPGDTSLCGCDLIGDTELGWGQAQETNDPVDCVHCKRIYDACKKIKSKEFKPD